MFAKRLLPLIKRYKKPLALGLIPLFLLLYFLLPKNQNATLTATASKNDITKIVSVTGDVAADLTVDLKFQSGEALSWVGVKEGDYVVRGQAIASLDRSKLQASFRQAEQDFIAAKAESEKYYDGHKNATESFDEKIERTAIDATQNKAYDSMKKVEYDLAHSTLYSPIYGIVTRSDTPVAGVNVTATTTFTVTDPSSLSFKMEVDEADIGNIKEGQEIKVIFDSFPDKEVTLKINSIDFVSHKTSSGGNAFYVKASLSDPSKYRVGMSGNADIIISSKKNVLSVPSSSVFEDEYVFVKRGNYFEKTKVRVGLQSDTLAEIVSGISDGDAVAVDPNLVPLKLIRK